MSESSMERDMGRMEAKIAVLESEVATIRQQMADVHKVVMQAQGSWKALVMASGAGAAVMAAGVKLAALFGFGR